MPIVVEDKGKPNKRKAGWWAAAVFAFPVVLFCVTLVQPIHFDNGRWSLTVGLEGDAGDPVGFSTFGPAGLAGDFYGCVYSRGSWEYRIEFGFYKPDPRFPNG